MNNHLIPTLPRPAMLLHGLISTPGEFATVRAALARDGLELYTPELEAYSFRQGMQPARWQDWLAAARRELIAISDAQGPVVIGGLCIGAVLALALAEEMPERVAGLLLLSPTLYYDGWGLSRWLHLRHLGYRLPGLRNWIQIDEREPFGVKNPQIRKWIAREMRQQAHSNAGAAKLPLWAIHEAERLIRRVRTGLPKLRMPTLILHAREDEVASMRSPDYLMRHLGSHDKRLVVLDNSYHMITLDNDRMQVVREMNAFIRRHGAAEARTTIVSVPSHGTPQQDLVCQPL
jgi:carboxylesterase